MISLTKKRDQAGFTIVELLIVIVVIGILAALVITTYSGIQAKARDSQRQNNLGAVQTQLEAYFQDNQTYPSYSDMDSSSWLTTNMKSLDQTALHDPSATSSGITLANTAQTKAGSYWYIPTPSNCDASATPCTGYTLGAWLESSGSAYTKVNLD